MQVYLVDGTYELFRYHFALPSHMTATGMEVAATRGVVGTCLQLVEEGATHIGVATDHVIESFRNDLWPGYKTSEGMPPDLLGQFSLVEDALTSAGFVVFAMVEYEADDALAAAAALAANDERAEQVVICTPDKDLGQCVVGQRVVQRDRRKKLTIDEAGVIDKFGVRPESIPDYLALVGDSADGFPGLAGWGAKSTSAVLWRYPHIEEIPAAANEWGLDVRGASKLAGTLRNQLDLALLFRKIATVDRSAPTVGSVDELAWTGPTPAFAEMCERIEAPELLARATAASRSLAP